MKKIVLPAILVILLWWLIFLLFEWKKANEVVNKKIQHTTKNFVATYNYLEKNYKWNYPIPQWDLVLLNKKGEMIHLEDRKTPLNQIKDLYAIQGTTCDILKDDKQFNKINYDARYSIIDENGKVLAKKCFSYSVTKDGKSFQIWTIENGKAVLKWNSKKNITKSYDSPALVKNDSTDFLPYSPDKLSPLFQVKNLGSSQLSVRVIDDEDNEDVFGLVEGNNTILKKWVDATYQISLKWKIDPNTKLKFIDTDGSIVYIAWDENWNVDFQLKDYRIDTNRVDYIVETGKFLADIVRLSPDKDMTVSKNGTTLVIRWTKFSIDSVWNEMNTYLVLWKIVEKIKNGENITLDMLNSFSSVFGDKIKSNVDKMKQLVNFIVYNDIVNYPKYGFSVNKLNWMTDILSGSKLTLNINYENWQNISLIAVNRNDFKNILNSQNIDFSSCHGKVGCIEAKKYEHVVSNFCKKNAYKKGLDIDKLHYLLDIPEEGNYKKFALKSKIQDELWINDYMLITSRSWWADPTVRQSTVKVVYKSSGEITNEWLPRLLKQNSLNWINNVVFACEY